MLPQLLYNPDSHSMSYKDDINEYYWNDITSSISGSWYNISRNTQSLASFPIDGVSYFTEPPSITNNNSESLYSGLIWFFNIDNGVYSSITNSLSITQSLQIIATQSLESGRGMYRFLSNVSSSIQVKADVGLDTYLTIKNVTSNSIIINTQSLASSINYIFIPESYNNYEISSSIKSLL